MQRIVRRQKESYQVDDEDHCSDAEDNNKGDNRELGGDSAKETEDEDRDEKLNRVVKKKKKKKSCLMIGSAMKLGVTTE